MNPKKASSVDNTASNASKHEASACVYFPGDAARAMLIGYALLDILLLKMSGLSIVNATLIVISSAFLIVIGIWTVWRRLDARMTSISSVVLFFIILACMGVVLSYSITALSIFPVFDTAMLAADHRIGFDWHEFVSRFDPYETVCLILGVSYLTIWFQIVALAAIAAINSDHTTADAVMLSVGISLLIVNAAAFFVPTVGVTTLQPHAFEHMNVAGGILGQNDYLALRDGSLNKIDFEAIVGLVTFPSYHAVIAFLATFASRRIRFAFIPFLILNALVLISTFTHGGHYLTDVVAGAVIAAISWQCANNLVSRRREGFLLNWEPITVMEATVPRSGIDSP